MPANELALRHGARLLSAYRTRLDEKLWVITEWDRSATTLLLPADLCCCRPIYVDFAMIAGERSNGFG